MTITNEDTIPNPLTAEQNQRAAALSIASGVDFISTTEEVLSLADYIVGCQCPEPSPLFGPFSTSLDFELTDLNTEAIRLFFGDVVEGIKDEPTVEVGDELDTYDEVKALPVGTTLIDRQVDYISGTWVVTEGGPVFNEGIPWQEDSRVAFETYAPFTITSLPDAKDEDDEPEAEKPEPIFAVGDHVIISENGGKHIGNAGRYMGTVTRVVEDYDHEDGGVRYYETTVRPGGVGENFLEWAHEYLCDDKIEGAIFVHDEEGLDALPAGAVIETASGYVGLVVAEDGELGNTRSNPSAGGWRRTVLGDMASGHPFRVVHVGGSGI